MEKKPTLSYILDTRGTKEFGYGIVKVRVTYNRQPRPYSVGIQVNINDWNKLQRNIDENGLSGKIKDEYLLSLYNTLYKNPDSYIKLAEKIIKKIENDFDFHSFKEYFDNPSLLNNEKADKKRSTNVIVCLMDTKKTLIANNQVGTGEGYGFTATSLIRFLESLSSFQKSSIDLPLNINESNLQFKHITVAFLNEYEKWMLIFGKAPKKKGNPPTPATETTIGIYLRNLRAEFNKAISDGVIEQSKYPFGSKGYTISSTEGTKKALKKNDIEKILNYQPEKGTYEDRSWSLWIFSYLSNGMNFADICRLKWENIDYKNKKIEFIRTKTTKTKKAKKKKISTLLFPQLEQIIDYWKDTDNNSGYIFPFLKGITDPIRIKRTTEQIIKKTNEHLSKIALKLEIDEDLDTYVARHSFATILLRNKVPIPFISSALGHGDLKTTMSYLGSFEDDDVKEFLTVLI